ncbi:MAG: zinc ribbon domain-containing protein [Gaiellaceae bacterium]|jgi:hypothetical protein
MERRSLFTRLRRSGDAGSSAEGEPEPASEAVDDERSAEVTPEAKLSPAPISGEEPEAEQLAPEELDHDDRGGPKQKAEKVKLPRPPSVNLSLVRRERRILKRERERRIRDLGGLLLEMYRRDQFREDLIVEHCAQTMGIENRIHELEAILERATSRRITPGPHCSCGAPLFFGAHFCANCGRPTDLAATGELCARCLQPLAVGASFCANCGAAIGDSADSNAVSEHTISHAPPSLQESEPTTPGEGDE